MLRSLKQVANWLLPGSCLLCSLDCETELLCPACQRSLPTLPRPCCTVCALPLNSQGECPACTRKHPHFDAAHALFPYDFPVDRLIHSLKYGHHLGIARWLGDLLAARINLADADIMLVPIPLHPTRLQGRGFNQAHEIARHLASKTKLRVSNDLLFRTRATAAQAGLELGARGLNIANAFECKIDLRGQHLVLIDDVLTTGNTLNEAARILKLHGARYVSVVVAARALRHPTDAR